MRIEVYATRNDHKGVAIFGTAHSKKELYQLKFKALKNGFDYIFESEY